MSNIKPPIFKNVIFIGFVFIYQLSHGQQPNLVLPIGHAFVITSANFSPDGKKIVTVSYEKSAKIWDIESGRLLYDLTHKENVNSANFSPDGKKIVTTSYDNTAKIWDTESGKLLHDLIGHDSNVVSANFSPNGKMIVTASWDKTAKIWDSKSGKLLHDLTKHTGPVNLANFSPNSEMIITASDKTIKIWKSKNGKLFHNLTRRNTDIRLVNFSPDSKRIVTVSIDKKVKFTPFDRSRNVTVSIDEKVKIWDTESGKLLHLLIGHARTINSTNFSLDGKRIITASDDKTAKIWDTESGKLLYNLIGHSSDVVSANFSPDGKKIVTVSKVDSAKIWDSKSGKLLRILIGHSSRSNSANFSPDGKKIVTASKYGSATIWDSESGKLLKDLHGRNPAAYSANFSIDGKSIVTTAYRSIRIWDTESGKLLHLLIGHTLRINSTNFSLDGKRIITTSDDKTAKIWDTESGKLLYDLEHKERVYSANFSPDGKKIVTASKDRSVKIWDSESGKLLHDLTKHHNDYYSANFSPDGKKIVTASDDNTAKIWDTESGKLLHHLIKFRKFLGLMLANFSPDGKKIVTASMDGSVNIWDTESGKFLYNLMDGSVKKWDTESGKYLYNLFGHSSEVESANFSPDGKKIVTASWDKSAKIWDSETGKLLQVLTGHRDMVHSANFSPDGKKIITTSDDNTTKLWDSESGKLLNDLIGDGIGVKAANFSPNGKRIITASSDNTIKIWDSETAESLYTFFPIDSQDYIVYNKDFQYDGTESARKLLYYTCGDEIIELDQLKDLCWEPDLVSKINGINPEPITAKKLSDIDICNFIPKVEDEGLEEGYYYFKVIPRKGGLGQVQLFVNDKLIKTYDSSQLLKNVGYYSLSVSQKEVEPFFLSGNENIVTVKARTRAGTMSSRGAQIINYEQKNNAENPNIYIVSIGVSAYKGDKLKLKYASKDAIDLASALKASAKKLLNTDGKEHVSSIVFHTELGGKRWPNKDAIKRTMDSIALVAKADDILVIFFGGHGVLVSGEKKNLYLLTAEASAFDMIGAEKEIAISTNELNQWMRNIKANKQLLILDACNSGQMVENIKELLTMKDIPADQQRALEDLKDKTGTYILSASASGQSAYETSLYDHGLLTQSLLSSIKLGNGLKDNKYLDVTKWFNTSSDQVKILAKDIGGRQDPQILGNASFHVGLADDEVRDGIKLSIRKKIFKGSNIIKEGLMPIDNLDLTPLVDKELNEVSVKGNNSLFTYSKDNTFQEAYSILGRYSVNGNSLTINVFLIKGHMEKSIYQFELKGEMDKKEDLAKRIVEKVNAFLMK